MSTHWRFDSGCSPDFHDSTEAEQWLSENWRSLLDAGVEVVELIVDDEAVYSMPLTEE